MVTFDIITSNGEIIPLKGIETTQPLKTVNSSFEFEAITGQVVWDLEIPVEPNTEALGTDHHISATSEVKIYNAQLKEDNVTLFKGILTRYDSTMAEGGAIIQAEFIVDDFVYRSLNLTIQQVCNQVIDLRPNGAVTINEAAKLYSSLSYPETKISFPVAKAESFYGNSNEAFSGIINAYDTTTEQYLVSSVLNTDSAIDFYETKYNFVPFVYLLAVFDGISKELGYKFLGTLFLSKTIKSVLVAGAFALDSVESQNLAYILKTEGPPQGINDISDTLYVNFNQIGPLNEYQDLDLTQDRPYEITSQSPLIISLTIQYLYNQEPYVSGDAGLDIHVKTNGNSGSGIQFSETFSEDDNDFQFSVINRTVTYQLPFTPALADVGQSLGVFIEVNTFSANVNYMWVRSVDLVIGLAEESTINYSLTQYRLGDSLPPIGITDFIRRIKNTFCTTLDIDQVNRTITMDLLNKPVNKQPIEIESNQTGFTYSKKPIKNTLYTLTHGSDATEKPSRYIGDFNSFSQLPGTRIYNTALVLNERAFYRYVFNPDITDDQDNIIGGFEWQYLEEALDSYSEGPENAEPVEISTQVTIPKSIRTTYTEDSTVEFLLPELEYEGASQSYGMPELPQHELHLMFYVGLQPASTGTYPMAATTARNYLGNLTLGDVLTHSMYWGSSYGLHAKFWSRWLRILATKEQVEITCALPLAEKPGKTLNNPIRVHDQLMIREEQSSVLGSEAFHKLICRKN